MTSIVSRADEKTTPAAAWPAAREAWTTVWLLHAAYIFSMIDRMIVGQLAPGIQRDLGLTDTDLGLIQGVGFATCYTLFGLLFGWMVDRFSRRALLVVGIAVWCIATVACGFAIGFWSLAAFRIGVAIGEAALNPAATSLIADSFRPEDRARPFGIHQMGAAVGSFLAFLCGGLLLSWLEPRGGLTILGHRLTPWEAVFVVVGAPGLLVAFALMRLREPARRQVAIASAGRSAGWMEALGFMRQNAWPLFCLNGGVALVMLSVYGWLFWLPSFFQRVHGWPVSYSAEMYAITGGVTGIISAAISGPVTNWFERRGRTDAAMLTCAIGALGCVAFSILAPIAASPWMAIVWFSLAKLFLNLPTAAALNCISEITPNEHRGKVTAVYILCLGVLASGSGSLVVALLTDHVFADKSAIGTSIFATNVVCGGLGTILLFAGLRSYAASRRRALAWLRS